MFKNAINPSLPMFLKLFLIFLCCKVTYYIFFIHIRPLRGWQDATCETSVKKKIK